MYVLWKKQYQAFYDQYTELVKRLLQNPHCPETRYLNEHFLDLFKRLDVSRLSAQQQMSFEKIIQQMSALLDDGEGEGQELDEQAASTAAAVAGDAAVSTGAGTPVDHSDRVTAAVAKKKK